MKLRTIFNWVAYALSAAIITASITASYLFLAPITVLTNWQLAVDGDEFALGQSVVIESTYHKQRNVSGVSHRYIECQDARQLWIRYPLNDATADRQAGNRGTGVVVTIPTDIPQISLPTSCHFTIVIDYKVYSFRTVTESNQTRDFTVLPVLPPTGESPGQPLTTSDDPFRNQASSSTPSARIDEPATAQQAAPAVATPPAQPAPSTPEPSPAPAPEPASPSLLEQIHTALEGVPLIGRLLR